MIHWPRKKVKRRFHHQWLEMPGTAFTTLDWVWLYLRKDAPGRLQGTVPPGQGVISKEAVLLFRRVLVAVHQPALRIAQVAGIAAVVPDRIIGQAPVQTVDVVAPLTTE